MINVSNDFILRAQNNPNYLYTLEITLKDGTILNLTNKDIIYGGITIDEAVSGESVLSVGAAIINSLTVLIDNREEAYEYYNFKDAKVELTVGLTLVNNTTESFKRGTYTVVTADYNSSAIKLTCYDNIYKLEKPYIESTLAYPATVSDIVDDICDICDIELAQDVNLHFGNTVIQKNPADLTTTCRSIISYIAQINCTNAVCTPDGKLDFVWYSNGFTNGVTYIRVAESAEIRKAETDEIRTTEVVLSEVDWNNVVSIDGLFERNLDRFDTLITGVRIILPTDNDENAISKYVSGSDEYLITIENNPFITVDNVNTILSYISGILVNFYYRKGKLSHIGFPYITAGDVAEVTDKNGQTHICLVTATTFIAGQRQRTVSSGAAPATANGAQFSDITKQYVKYIKGAGMATAGLFETQVVDQSTQARIIYLHNRPQLAESNVQIKITADGVMVTANGLDTTPTWYGLSVDGNLIANILQANGINANWITTGKLQSTDNRAFFDLTNGYFAIANSTNLTRIVFRGWSGAFFIQHRISIDDDWDFSKEMGANTTDTYVFGEIWAAQGSSCIAMQYYYLGTYDERNRLAISSRNSDTDALETTIYSNKIQVNTSDYLSTSYFDPDIWSMYTDSSTKSFLVRINEYGGAMGYWTLDSINNNWISQWFIGTADTAVSDLTLDAPNGKIQLVGSSVDVYYNRSRMGPAIGGGNGSDLAYIMKQIYLGGGGGGAKFAMFVTAAGTTYYVQVATSSDERIKKNIGESKENALEVIEKIKHVSFDFKESNVHRDNGYVAQQLEEINPVFVSLIKNPDETEIYVVNQYEILTYATKAIQELSEKNKRLEERVNKLEQMIEKYINNK